MPVHNLFAAPGQHRDPESELLDRNDHLLDRTIMLTKTVLCGNL
jgi:hypothetical protein